MNENNINSNLEQNVQNNMEELPTSNITEEAPSTDPLPVEQPVVQETPVEQPVQVPVTTEPKKKNTALIIVIIIIAIVLLVGGVLIAIKFLAPKKEPKLSNNTNTNTNTTTNNNNNNTNNNTNVNSNTKEEKVVLYTFEDPLGNTISMIKKPYQGTEFIGVDLSRYSDKSYELGKKASVITDEEIKKLNLPEEYEKALDYLQRHVGCSTCEGISKQTLLTELKDYYLIKGKDEIIEYAIENCKIDYKEQALIHVYHVLSQGISKELLPRNLSSSNFTEEEANYALSQLEEIDFYEQALEDACWERFALGKEDIEEVRKVLIRRKYTEEEIQYALKIVFEEIK